MKKNGFTLIEILAVIVLIAIITTIGTAGINAARNSINQKLWQETINLIETGAVNYGEDNKNRLIYTCTIGTETKDMCIEVKVEELIDNDYIVTKEKDESGNKVLINKTIAKGEQGYIVNDKKVFVYLENNVVYAKYEDNIE